MLAGNVLITGGSGYLGRAILEKAKRENWPARFTVYSRDETKQWELKHRFPQVNCVLGDVSRDLDRLIMLCYGIDCIIHAAAIKHIPEAEHNVQETIDVNVVGSRNVAVAAIASGVTKVVGISTDKASAPLNVYGMTKAIMERLFSEFSRNSKTDFVTVRYGNVVGSTGSVIPLFKRQIVEYGQIRVTDQRMTRFWLAPFDAVDMITAAYHDAHDLSGKTLIAACPSMRITDLAEAVFKYSKSSSDKNIVYTGMRPGEKLHESLFNEQEAPRVSSFKSYMAMRPATSIEPSSGFTQGYSSDNPRRWLSVNEMVEMMYQAEEI